MKCKKTKASWKILGVAPMEIIKPELETTFAGKEVLFPTSFCVAYLLH